MEITAEIFKKYTGKDHQDDDLERCNCQKAGENWHLFCGWNHDKNQPVFYGGIDHSKVESGYYKVDLTK